MEFDCEDLTQGLEKHQAAPCDARVCKDAPPMRGNKELRPPPPKWVGIARLTAAPLLNRVRVSMSEDHAIYIVVVVGV